jgi:hypothetical protein
VYIDKHPARLRRFAHLDFPMQAARLGNQE